MRVLPSVALLSAALLPVGPVGAQQAEVARYGLEQGLPQSMVNHVVQDSLGFLWFGTGYGLARFDGVRWAEFKHDAYDTTTISNDAIWGIAALPHGDLLVATAVGLDRYHAHTGRFTRLRTGVAPDGCWRPLHADARRVLMYSPLSASFLVVDAQGGTRAIPSGHGPSYAMRASPDGMRVRYHVSPDTLVDHDLATGQRTYARLPAAVRGGLRDLLPVDDGLLVLTDRGAWTVDEAGGCTPLPGEAGALLRDAAGNKLVQRAPGGRLWVAMDGTGVIELDDRWGVRAHYPLLPPEERPLLLTSLSFDRQGNVWAGTDGKGVFRIAPQRIKFGRAMPGVLPGWSPRSWFVRGFAQWDGTRVLVTFHQGGAALFDERDGHLRPLDLARDLGVAPPDRTIDRSLNDAHGNIWLKCGPQVVVLAPGGRRAIDRINVQPGAFLFNDPQGRVVLAQTTGTRRAVADDDAVRWEPLAFPGLAEALAGHVDRLAMDPDGQLWSSHLHAGLRLWSAHGERPLGRGWDGPEGTRFKLSAVVPAANGRAWVATDRGLLEVDPGTGDLRGHLTRRHGLPDDHIYGVVVDDAGTCWGSTNKGLFRMQGGQVRNYTPADGLQSKEFNGHAWFRSASGRIYFGGTNGFNHFMPGAVRDDPDPPRVRIVRLL
ncbi:MAG: hypothetical protein RBT71_08170, partial [Flavobacteriales bacterium]|nr:hypothetical protein [Flavobacteriales bacterium]